MKCFNHTEREAVATCQKCGKGLCKECAEKYTPCMCDTCAEQTRKNQQQQAQNKEEQRKQKYKDALVDTRGEFIKTAVIGIVVASIWIWYSYHNQQGLHEDYGLGDWFGMFFVAFCIPFGWKVLTYLQSFIPISIFGTWWFWIIYTAVKACLSALVGIPAFFYQLVKTILTQRKINKLK
ncbi:MAG: hypothetical protein OSJ59_09060 [Lachnospiraceae bacterium]|nr:hypothetical protein [Lachnospiraceae bacterium]